MAALVLIVDDNEQNIELAAFLLEQSGFAVDAVADAARVIARVLETRPDLVLMDVQLPGTDGPTLMRALKKIPACARLPIVAYTAHAMRGDEARLLAEGFDGYIAKPIDVSTFATRVASLLSARPRD